MDRRRAGAPKGNPANPRMWAYPGLQQGIVQPESEREAVGGDVDLPKASPSPTQRAPFVKVTAQQHDSCQHHELKPLKDAGLLAQAKPLKPAEWKVKALETRKMLWTFIHSYQ